MTNDEVEKKIAEWSDENGYWQMPEAIALIRRLRDERDQARELYTERSADIVELGIMVGEARNKALDEAAEALSKLYQDEDGRIGTIEATDAILALKTQAPSFSFTPEDGIEITPEMTAAGEDVICSKVAEANYYISCRPSELAELVFLAMWSKRKILEFRRPTHWMPFPAPPKHEPKP